MFNKNPFEVKIDTNDHNINHNINIDVNPDIPLKAFVLVKEAGRTAIKVLIVAAAAKTASDILTHIAKTKI